MLEKTLEMLDTLAMPGLKELALGGTAVGTGLNASEGLRRTPLQKTVSELTGKDVRDRGEQIPRADFEGRSRICPRRAEGAGRGHDEDRQRRALAGFRSALTVSAKSSFRKTSRVRRSCRARSIPRSAKSMTMVAVQVMAQRCRGRNGGFAGQFRTERIHARLHLQFPAVCAAAGGRRFASFNDHCACRNHARTAKR